MLRSLSISSLIMMMSVLAPVGQSNAESGVEYGLTGPHIYDAQRRSLGLTIADLNGDGRLDLASASNDSGLLEILYQNNEDASEPFSKEEVTLDGLVRSMIAADVNGDGRTDLLIAQAPSGLAIMYQTGEGRLQRGEMTDLKADYLTLEDLNGDGRKDVLAVVGKKIQILRAGTRGISLEPVETFYTTVQIAEPPMVLDLDGDGRNDIVYQPADKRDCLMVRSQSATGDFPAEFALNTSLLRSIAPIPLPLDRAKIAAIHNKTRHLVVMEMAKPLDASAEPSGTLNLSEPRVVGFDPNTWDQDTFSAVADVDGDGRSDLLAAMPNSASLRMLHQTRTGALLAETVPSLAGVRQILPWPVKRGTAAPLILLSKKENALGVARVDKNQDGRLGFPRPLEMGAKPLAAGILHVGGTDAPDLLVAIEGTDGQKRLVVSEDFDPTADSPPAWRELLVLDDDSEAPESLTVADLDRDGRQDLILHFEYESPLLLMQEVGGGFAKRDIGGILSGLLENARDNRLFTARLRGDDDPVLLAVKDDYLRAFYLEQDGGVHIAQQFNGRDNRTRLRAAITANLRGPDTREVVLLDIGNSLLTIHGVKKGKKSYEPLREVELDDANYRRLEAFDLDGDERDDLILIAPDRVAVIYSRALNGELETIETYETAIEDGGYGLVQTLPLLGSEKHPQVVCVEMRQQMLEFLHLDRKSRGADFALHAFYKFRVFESESTIARRVNMDAQPEPRQFAAEDLNGDGKADLVVLVNDKLIVYYQK